MADWGRTPKIVVRDATLNKPLKNCESCPVSLFTHYDNDFQHVPKFPSSSDNNDDKL